MIDAITTRIADDIVGDQSLIDELGQTTMSNRKILKDKSFRILGYLDTASDGSQTLQDADHRLVGYYKARSGVTTNEQHRIVGRGNILLSLLPER